MSPGLAKARERYHHRGGRARELRSQGKKVIGYFCCYPPVEFITALDMVPYRISGRIWEPIARADAYLETIMCPFIRSCFDLALRGDYDFLDGLVVPHSCDTVQRIYDIWKHYRPPAYAHFLNVPHMVQPSSFDFFYQELQRFKKSLEDFAGREMSRERLVQAVRAHNENRALMRELYQLRREDPPPLSGVEAIEAVTAGVTLPVEEYNQLLKEIILEVARRERLSGEKRKPRILVYGSEIDDAAFIRLVEECGAEVVMDDLCTGTRYFWHDVELTPDPLEGLTERYLDKLECPRTYRPRSGTRQEDLENRFGYLQRYIKDFKVDGVILYIIRFCDTYELDAPDVKDYVQGLGLPVLHIEHDYSAATLEPLRTRIQAFLEMIAEASPAS
jgi:bzd-type benzoyl-CoA reductase N subunit